MKTAKEMFEALGFFLAEDTNERVWFQRHKKQIGMYPLVDEIKNVEFRKDKRAIRLCGDNCTQAYGLWELLTVNEFLAITQQMKELGWI